MSNSPNDKYVFEAFLHFSGESHEFREIFDPSEPDEAKRYVEGMLRRKFDYELPHGEWRDVPGGDGLLYWPGDPYLDANDGDVPPERTKGYVMKRPIRTSSKTTLNAQSAHPQIFRSSRSGRRGRVTSAVRRLFGCVRIRGTSK